MEGLTYLVGVDVGTSSTKAVVIDEDERVLARSSSEYGIDSPKARVRVGVYKNLDEACERTIRILDREEPDAEEVEIYNDYCRNVYRRLYPSLKPIWSEHPS